MAFGLLTDMFATYPLPAFDTADTIHLAADGIHVSKWKSEAELETLVERYGEGCRDDPHLPASTDTGSRR
ncbi:hypothetical protein [Paraburkholderia sp. RL17-373-BIF-A]|uniref:hypothetical protein n=1 Tax=Paraburkholderia sp. RL17-373-BIF-A TaxID=3031629 RepID=UPI0038BDB338